MDDAGPLYALWCLSFLVSFFIFLFLGEIFLSIMSLGILAVLFKLVE